ncbi:anthranilate phosphoribosyltransferase [Desulfofustis limnaeus]|jgi:anthranilate phosphoribosyltransferase|uniref:Anthranilate phosphoribosyltransferase n=1 Tax=Desulfofustis limnaeus TaxID=2740163 RepID=A0ABM7W911_9BACT|nr:anthranilate phosphoribosyltransferase [Desulfofustis limnaeus]MDX9896627.1 anthranilate phosphoribosyltransferase [Desulfofustis sp.]BDD87414.1 anthranilate phosphoribosyltransferase [Desulfofustis limnaeus]
MTIREAITQVVNRVHLSELEMYQVMTEIMSGAATPAQIGSFLTGLRMKGETVDEIAGAVRVMREKAKTVDTGVDMAAGGTVIDTCGTGGDCSGTFNVSTTSAFVVAGCGFTVAKHGNRSVSSSCGSADVLEAAGVRLDLTPEQVGECIRRTGIGFLFAPALHGAMKYAIGPRREIGIRTIFNILGPLTNPAGANVQVLGVFAAELTEQLAEVLGRLGSRRALVVHGEGNLDELTITGSTLVAELRDGQVSSYRITPEEVGLPRTSLDSLKGGRDSVESAAMMKDILAGTPGPRRDMVLLNSGAALLAAGAADDLQAGIALAAECIDSGRALAKLEDLIVASTRFA